MKSDVVVLGYILKTEIEPILGALVVNGLQFSPADFKVDTEMENVF